MEKEDVLINVPRFGYRVVRMTEKDARDADAFGDRGQEQNGNFSVDMVCCNKDCSGRTDRRATIMDDGNNCASQVHPPIFSLPLKAAAST